jgi:D-cysteine desulfhydrase
MKASTVMDDRILSRSYRVRADLMEQVNAMVLPLPTFEAPRFGLAHLPTPLQRSRFGWGDRRLLVKRDDLTGCALTGNKVRKLEFLLADAQRCGADTLLTCGGAQSNCARAAAVAAAQLGMHSVLVLTGPAGSESDGNLLINRLTGAETILLPDATALQRDAALAAKDEELRGLGRRPYLIPFGGSSEVGTLGYVFAAIEIAGQLKTMGAHVGDVFVPLASGGTYAGLLLGFRLAGFGVRVLAAVVEGNPAEWPAKLLQLAEGAARLLGTSSPLTEADIHLLDARGLGYGKPSAAEYEFIVHFARETGLLVDPVYTGKALYAYDRAVASGMTPTTGDVLFVHTGGCFGLFPHKEGLQQAIDKCDQPRESLRLPRSPVLATPRPVPAGQRISIASPYE